MKIIARGIVTINTTMPMRGPIIVGVSSGNAVAGSFVLLVTESDEQLLLSQTPCPEMQCFKRSCLG